jgi:hypothetical protein
MRTAAHGLGSKIGYCYRWLSLNGANGLVQTAFTPNADPSGHHDRTQNAFYGKRTFQAVVEQSVNNSPLIAGNRAIFPGAPPGKWLAVMQLL